MSTSARRSVRVLVCLGAIVLGGSFVWAAILNLTMEDFHLRGTQLGELVGSPITTSHDCMGCHSGYDEQNSPMDTWAGSLMANAGRDPLFFAQMATANQDVANAGNFCMRCHVPLSFVSGHANPPDGSALDSFDADGVSCNFCHSMVDPIYRPGISPPEDEAILAGLASGPPQYYGNAMFVLDPSGMRRGARPDHHAFHPLVVDGFQRTGEYCGTCHEVGNVAVSRQPDGTYRYNPIGAPTPDENPHSQFPLERTFSEWRLSAFANGGVDMGGRFGGTGGPVVSTCQDCHMPKAAARACAFGPDRPDVARHEFAGASAQVLDLIAEYTRDDPNVDPAALARGRAAAVSMLERAATLELSTSGSTLNVRVINESGHKLPTGHIEGRRVWINVRFFDQAGTVVGERGHYDQAEAELDAASTVVYEMHVGLSPFAAGITGLPAGPTGRMALADTIVKDSRIPPRGFSNAAYAAAGAPVVEHIYADGQYWDDASFGTPVRARRAEVRLYYQQTPREYVEALRDNNTTDDWGDVLYALWEATGRGAPIEMTFAGIALPCRADFNGSGSVSVEDLFSFLRAWFGRDPGADVNGSGDVTIQDIFDFLAAWFGGC